MVRREVAGFDRVVTELQKQIITLDSLPPEHVHCATLAVNTLREAIAHRRQEGGKGFE